VEHGRSGYLCSVMDSYDLAKKMEKMINLSEKKRLHMGEIGRMHVASEFDDKIVIDKYLRAIKENILDKQVSKFVLKNRFDV
jgi:glycosyltransferase involved in cell wall biosynthesis